MRFNQTLSGAKFPLKNFCNEKRKTKKMTRVEAGHGYF